LLPIKPLENTDKMTITGN